MQVDHGLEISNDGKTYQFLTVVKNDIGTDVKGPVHRVMGEYINAKARYLRFIALRGGILPAWHESAGSPSHVFIDEVIVK